MLVELLGEMLEEQMLVKLLEEQMLVQLLGELLEELLGVLILV